MQFVRIDGEAIGDAIKDSREVQGPLPDLLSQVDDVLKANIQTSVDFTSGRVEVRKPDYPLVALQQIARNAILHRSYENTNAPVRLYWFNDRVEIQNPGGPFGQVTKQKFRPPRRLRLPESQPRRGYEGTWLRAAFRVRYRIARHELAKNGNPAIEFQVEDSHVAAIIRR